MAFHDVLKMYSFEDVLFLVTQKCVKNQILEVFVDIIDESLYGDVETILFFYPNTAHLGSHQTLISPCITKSNNTFCYKVGSKYISYLVGQLFSSETFFNTKYFLYNIEKSGCQHSFYNIFRFEMLSQT